MSQTVIRGTQILNNTVQRQDLDTSTAGQAVVTKVIQGSGITLSSTGADSGTGDVTVSSPDVVSTDAGNIATLGTDNHILVSNAQLWSVRLRSFNAIGNPTFEVDQRTVALGTNVSGGFALDRWKLFRSGSTLAATAVQTAASPPIVVPGTSFPITRSFLRVTLNTAQASLGASDYLFLLQFVEGPRLRELISGGHSLSFLVRSSVASLIFGATLRDSAEAYSLSNLCSLGAANTWTIVSLPNLAQWTASGSFPLTPGSVGYELVICLAAGSSVSNAPGSWLATGNYGANGQSNFAASALNSTFDLGFIQHEPGTLCTTPIDLPFGDNLNQCRGYFQKSYDLATRLATVTVNGARTDYALASGHPFFPVTFSPRMVKAPSSTAAYSSVTGAANNVADNSASVDRTTNGQGVWPSENGFNGYILNTPNAAQAQQSFHWVADTAM